MYPERRRRDGAVLLTHNHISLLQGLLDRPGGRALSKRDLIDAARPYIKRYRGSVPSWWTTYRSTNTLHPSWVYWKRKGNRIEFRLTPRGRGILDGKVRAHVLGHGAYVPAKALRRGAGPARSKRELTRLRRREVVTDILPGLAIGGADHGEAAVHPVAVRESAVRSPEGEAVVEGVRVLVLELEVPVGAAIRRVINARVRAVADREQVRLRGHSLPGPRGTGALPRPARRPGARWRLHRW
jgi:hypothetical protein